MAAKHELELKSLLLSTGMVQPLRSVSRGGNMSVLCRLVPGQEAAWLRTIEFLLKAAADLGIPLHLCKQFVLKDGHMVAGWHVGIEERGTAHLTAALTTLAPVFAAVLPELGPPSRVEPAPVQAAAVPAPPSPDADLEDEEQPMSADLLERRKAYQAKTIAPPRPPAPVSYETPRADPATAGKRVVQRGMTVDSSGKSMSVIIEEMPLPHVFHGDMNKPNEKGRGAKTLG